MNLDSLNPAQREAVTHTDGSLLLIAGAGAGKTRVITHRIAHLIESGVRPDKILAVTFTNKAAREMGERIAKLIPAEARPLIVTFHALGVLILKEHAALIERTRWFTILDRDDSISYIRKALRAKGYDPKTMAPERILGIISKAKGEGLDRKGFDEERPDDFISDIASEVWGEYSRALKEGNALDFDDLLLIPLLLLKNNESLRRLYQERWSHIHIDEFQDTNKVQYELARMLADKHKNICVVGDMDQTIYSWRGARAAHVLHFERDFPDTKTILLEENYRSTKNILGAANEIIRKNKLRKDKNLFTSRDDGAKIEIFDAFDEIDEAAHIAERARTILSGGQNPDEVAVLYRAGFQSRVLEELFLREDIPYQVLGTAFYDRKEVKDLLAFVRAALNPQDRYAIERVINIPKRGIGEKTVEKIFAGEALPARLAESYADFQKILAKIGSELISKQPSVSLRYIFKNSGIKEHYEHTDDGTDRILNMEELVNLAKKYDELPPERGIEKLLEDTSLLSDQDTLTKEKHGVRLMTVHAAKGLEFDYVFIVGLEQGLFPFDRSRFELSAEKNAESEEEERRLFYVALTRAKEKVFLSHASTRGFYGTRRMNIPSEFVADIPDTLKESTNPYRADSGTNLLGNIIDF